MNIKSESALKELEATLAQLPDDNTMRKRYGGMEH
jgi:hypothetical protein